MRLVPPGPARAWREDGWHGLGAWLADLALARPWRTIGVGVAVCLVLAAGVLRFQPSADYRIFFHHGDARLQALDALEAEFGGTDDVMFVVKPREGDVFAAETVAVVQELTEAAAGLPYVARVDSLATTTLSRLDGDALSIEPLLPATAGEATPERLASARRAALGEPLLVGAIVAADGGATGVDAVLALPGDDPLEVTRTADAARALAAKVQAEHPAIEVRVSGLAMLNDAFMQASVVEIASSVPLMVAVMVLGLALLLRSAHAMASIFTVVALSGGVAMGVGGWLGYPLTPISASAPTILLTLCVADGVHLFLSARQGRREGLDGREALRRSLAHNFKAVVLTSVSTMVGFAALNFADAPPFWHLANMTVAGVGAALVLSVTVLPALLSLRPIGEKGLFGERDGGGWGRAAAALTRGRWLVLTGGAAAAVAGGTLASRLENDDQFIRWFDPSVAWRADTEFMLEHLAGIYVVDFRVPAAGPEGVTDPAWLGAVDQFSTWLRGQPGVTHVSSLVDLEKRLHADFSGEADSAGAPGGYAVPDSQPLAAQYLLAYELALPAGRSLAHRVAADASAARVTAVVGAVSSREMQALTERAEAELARIAPPLATPAVSPVVLFSHLAQDNARGMVWGNLASLLLISLGMVAAMRSVKVGLASIVPNLLPIVLAYGAWTLLVGPMNIVSSIASAVCLGLVVDDTIHFLIKYQDARRREGLGPREAVAVTMGRVGDAMVLTSVVLAAGFGVLARSTFALNATFGQVVVLTVVLALLADLVLVPAGLVCLEEGWRSRPSARRAARPLPNPAGVPS